MQLGLHALLSLNNSLVRCPAEAEVKREMAAEAGGELNIPDVDRFDSNIITPVSTLSDTTLIFAISHNIPLHWQPPTSMQADTSHNERLLEFSGIVAAW